MLKITFHKPKRTKYGAKKVEVDGIVFDSKKEANRYKILKRMEEDGQIHDLELQKRWVLQDGFRAKDGKWIRPITYLSDFSYTEGDTKVVEDVKSAATVRDDVFKLKKKMFIRRYEDEYTFRVVI